MRDEAWRMRREGKDGVCQRWGDAAPSGLRPAASPAKAELSHVTFRYHYNVILNLFSCAGLRLRIHRTPKDGVSRRLHFDSG
jgi:hypothetical protein